MKYKLTSEEACAAVLDIMKMKIDVTSRNLAGLAFYNLYGDQGLTDYRNTKNEEEWYDSHNAMAALEWYSKQQLTSKGVIEGEDSSRSFQIL